ncbi:MAG: family 78 glycoside hydrolase catalytic domain [Bacteroidales bacterium]|nr:family 78 glycoside hydrolase catalytic domain [Bacteroidales bacterium]
MRLTSLFFLFTGLLFLFTGCSQTSGSLAVSDLRSENLTDPPGLGTDMPGLSWKITSAKNGSVQKAFQILAASNTGLLDEKNADLWNSGKIISPESHLVPYGGRELGSGSPCYWKVRIWDADDNCSEWSDAAFFSTGLLEESEWNAEFIGFPAGPGYSVSPQLKRNFTLDETGEKVFLYVNSLGYHEVYVNGIKAGDYVLSPSVSQFSRRSLVLTYDISHMLRKGRNDLVVWTGRGWYSEGLPGVSASVPLVRVQAEKVNRGRREQILVTDTLWEGRNSGYSTIGTWRPHQFGGEYTDASLLLPDLTAESLDRVSWTSVFSAENPGAEATAQLCEPDRIFESIHAASVVKVNDSTWLADMGKCITGYAEIHFPRLNRGDRILMEYCDHLDDDGNTVNQGQMDIFISAGGKDEYFRNKFNYHGFRYIRISNLPQEPLPAGIKAHLIHTGYRHSSSFECSDPDLNRIHDMIRYTLRCVSLGGYLVDCPSLERLGYGGDGNASTGTAQIMFALGPLYSNWLQAWADCIREDGGMPHTAPNPYNAGGGPYWCGFIITASWKTYLNYGDAGILSEYYPVMQKWLEYVEKYSPRGLLERWPDTDYRNWFLGDWAVPEGVDQTDPASVSLVSNCFISECYENMEKIATVLGKTHDSEVYRQKHRHLKNLIHNTFYDAERSVYGSASQTDLTYPLLAGIVPDSLAGKVRENLRDVIVNRNRGHFACGLVGIPVFTEWAVKNREADLFLSMLLKRDYPGYLYMLENGATTTWEHWNGDRSRIHNCYNGIGQWFYQAVGGIRNDERDCAYRSIIIDPQVSEGISWANTSQETPYGIVKVNWKITNDIFHMEVRVPSGSRAVVIIPGHAEKYRMNGKNIRNEFSAAEIPGGSYIFEWQK